MQEKTIFLAIALDLHSVPFLRAGKVGGVSAMQEKTIFLAIALDLHYLCGHES